jgi:hypothetical protein
MMKKLIISAALFAAPLYAQAADNRQILYLSEPQRSHVLTEMRSLLDGTQKIIGALARDDMAAVADAAKAIGLNMGHSAEHALHDVLPKSFMMLGMSMHKDFDFIAQDALAIKNPKHSLHQLSETMQKCTVCHATYQIQTSTPANKVSAARLDEVAQRGSQVMPFDLEQTTHVFTKTPTGGIQQVVVKDKANTSQIKLIREHLSKIAQEFKQGDFSNPARIHGENMPGLSVLKKAKRGQLQIAYRELTDGAEISFHSDDLKLQSALHDYFDAQLSDHARHAVYGHDHPMMHGN